MKVPTFSTFLAERFYIENHLSDFLYALIFSQKSFRDKFIELCLNYELSENEISIYKERLVNIYREDKYLENSKKRTDITLEFHSTNKNILVEVKKYDIDTHQKDYLRVARRNHLVLLCIIPPNERESYGMNVIRWQDLLIAFDEIISSNEKEFGLYKEIINYMKIVTRSYQPMKINDKKNKLWIYYLNLLIRDIIISQRINPIDKNSFTDQGSGYFFIYGNSKLWFGLNYNEEHKDCFMGWIQKKEAPTIFHNLQGDKNNFSDDNLSDSDYCYKMNKNLYKEFFNTSTTKERQREILLDFFKDFIICKEI